MSGCASYKAVTNELERYHCLAALLVLRVPCLFRFEMHTCKQTGTCLLRCNAVTPASLNEHGVWVTGARGMDAAKSDVWAPGPHITRRGVHQLRLRQAAVSYQIGPNAGAVMAIAVASSQGHAT